MDRTVWPLTLRDLIVQELVERALLPGHYILGQQKKTSILPCPRGFSNAGTFDGRNGRNGRKTSPRVVFY